MIMTFITQDLGAAIGGAIQTAVGNAFSGLKLSGPAGLSLTYEPPAPQYIPNPDPSKPPLQVLT
jgi:hypothetical protein